MQIPSEQLKNLAVSPHLTDLATYGNKNNNITATIGWGSSDGEFSSKPLDYRQRDGKSYQNGLDLSVKTGCFQIQVTTMGIMEYTPMASDSWR